MISSKPNRELPFIAVTLLLSFIYYPAFTNEYAKMDTYAIYANVFLGYFDPLTSWVSVQGRPLTSLLTYACFSAAGDFPDLQWVRFLGFGGLVAFAFSLDRLLLAHGTKAVFRVFLILTLCSLPGLTTFVLWTVCFPYPWAAALAVWCGRLISEVTSSPFSRKRLSGFMGLFISLWIYQPSTLFALLPILLSTLSSKQSPSTLLRASAARISYLMAALGLYFILYKAVFLPLILFGGPPRQRLEATKDPGSKITYIFTEAIPETFQGWAFFYGNTASILASIAAMGLFAFGLIRRLQEERFRLLLTKACIVLWLLILSLLPLIYFHENRAYFRMMAAFAAILVFLISFPLSNLATKRSPFAISSLLIVASILHIFATVDVIHRVWITPTVAEHKAILSAFESSAPEEAPSTVIIVPLKSDVYGTDRSRYLYGSPSTKELWVLRRLAWFLAGRQYGEDYVHGRNFLSGENIPENPHALVLDANKALYGSTEAEAADPNALYKLSYRKQKWWLSPWLGIYQIIEINEDSTGRLNHLSLGTIDYRWQGSELFIKMAGLEWVTTNAEIFPLAHKTSDGSRIDLSRLSSDLEK